MNECQHEHGNSIGHKDKTENYKRYQVRRDDAKTYGVGVWEVFLCDDCGKLIDENNYSPMTGDEITAWINALMTIQRAKITEFIEGMQ